MFLEKNKVDEILCTLDAQGCIFPGFELTKANGQPCLIGTGGFSSVYEMNCLERSENKYVLKVLGFEKHIMTSENFWNTVRLQHSLNEHTPYVCRLIQAKEIRIVLDEEGKLQQVTEVEGERWEEDGLRLQFILMERLEDIISKNRFGKISLLRDELSTEDGVIDFAIQIGQALHYAHTNNILHRDVKLENIFWDESSKCYKLGDFGIAKYVVEGNANTVVYTDGYGAPEIEKRLYDKYNATVDIYSFGITLYLLLNNFRFPGSEGYYVNMVQYNPQFIFPAPIHASVGMVRIIRKMCQYYQNERYQSISEILIDLVALKNQGNHNSEDEEYELPDFETETYKEYKKHSNEINEHPEKSEIVQRAERKEYEKIYNELYNKESVGYLLGFTLILTLLIRGLEYDVSIIHQWQFFILPVMVLAEAIFLRFKEFHILFGAITICTGIYLCSSIGISIPHILLLTGVATGIPIFASSTAIAVILWSLIISSEKLLWLDIISNFDLSWILLGGAVYLLYDYITLRIVCDITDGIKANISMFIFDNLHFLLIPAGLILYLIDLLSDIQIPEIVNQIHLFRIGLIFLTSSIYYKIKNKNRQKDIDSENEE